LIDANLIPMYPDIAEHGGLLPAVRNALVGEPAFEIEGFGTGAHYAYLAFGSRSADVYLSAESRQFPFRAMRGRGGENFRGDELV
jgi:hypothetical protein